MKEKTFESMAVINPRAAGIDVGSKSHFVSVGQDPQKDVREFGVYSQDHEMMVGYFKSHGVTTVAMESTGSYWQSLFFCPPESRLRSVTRLGAPDQKRTG